MLIPGLFSSGFGRTIRFANLHGLFRTCFEGDCGLQGCRCNIGRNVAKSVPKGPLSQSGSHVIFKIVTDTRSPPPSPSPLHDDDNDDDDDDA